MAVNSWFEETEKYINSFKFQIQEEKKEIIQSQKKFSNLINSFSEKAPSSSVINSLFKDEEPGGFIINKNEEKRKQLAEQRKAEYNAYLEKKEAEQLAKKRTKQELLNISPKSILDSVDYEQVLAKRKEEEAKFRNMNHADVLHSTKPVLKDNSRYDFKSNPTSESNQYLPRNNLTPVDLPGSTISFERHSEFPLSNERKRLAEIEAENACLQEEILAKRLAEQNRKILLEYEKELKRNNDMKKEIENLQQALETSKINSLQSSPKSINRLILSPRITSRTEDFPKFGRTGGGGEPVRDSFGNLITLRGAKRESSSSEGSIMSFPSMQQQPIKDRMAFYREELQRQIDEKKHLEAMERAKARELEEKIAQRAEEQRLQMLQEAEREQMKNDKIKEDFQRQQERIRKLEEFQRKDAEERRRKIMEAKLREPEIVPPPELVQERSQSPPIPAVRTKVLMDKTVPPVTQTEVKSENVFSSIAEIRRKIMQEQKKPKKQLQNSYEVMNRRTVQEVSDDDDDIFSSSFRSTD